MEAKVNIDSGVCGFITTAYAVSKDGQNVKFDITTDCENICKLSRILAKISPIDAYQEISSNGQAMIMTNAREVLKGCCSGCAVPVGLFKVMQVACGLALPKDLTIKLSKED